MSEHDQAMETVAGWAGRREGREIIATMLYIDTLRNILDPVANKRGTVITSEEKQASIDTSIRTADHIIKRCREIPIP